MKLKFKKTNGGAALLAAFVCMVIQLLILVCREGGTLHSESALFFISYLDGRPFLNQVFDPLRNDWGFYQARELSYLFDALDARFVAFLLKKHIVWFHSLCSLLLCGVMVFIQHYFTRRFFPRVPGMLVTLFSVFFVLSAAVTGLNYFRCAKYLTATGLWGALFAAYGVFRYGTFRSKAALVFCLILMTLSDRQGFFFTAAFCGTVAVTMIYLNWKHSALSACRMRFPLLASAGVTLFGIINNLYLTPFLVRSINHYTPDFSYQRDFALTGNAVKQSGLFLFGNAGNWFSNFTGAVEIAAVTGGLLAAGLALYFFSRFRQGERRCGTIVLLWICAAGSMLVCASAMAARHPLIMLPDVVYGVYAINFFVITLFLLTLTAASGERKFCRALLLLVSVAIVLRLGGEAVGDRFKPATTSFPGWEMQQPLFKEMLRNPLFEEKNALLPYRMELFLEFYRKHILTKP